ncbi:MAG: flavodoxin family protein [Chloroflexi bacterium]|nr:flavodoxin family protein [Chloroflexota bacterium]
MKVLALNCSPRMDKGNTAMILTPFLEGMKEAGVEVVLYQVKKLKIAPCQGELNCYLKTPGECFQKDGMQTLYPKLREADIWVFATPVYWDGATGLMKNLMDRITPLSGPLYELRAGHCTVALRKGAKSGKVVLVSTCGLWEMDNFDPLLAHMKAFSRTASRKYAGAVLRPHADMMQPVMGEGASFEDIFKAARTAGCQLVRNGKMSDRTLSAISRELMPLKEYVNYINKGTLQALKKPNKR